MPSVCILTDSAAQFTAPVFPGQELVHILAYRVLRHGAQAELDAEAKLNALPASARNGDTPLAYPPTVEDFRQAFHSLGQQYREIIVLLTCAQFSSAAANAAAAANSRGAAVIHIIDAQTTSVGLGLLVQEAARAAAQEANGAQINRLLRGLMPHVYTVFCLQSLSYLAHNGLLDPAQAIAAEIAGLTSFLFLENGRLTPIQKARSPRHLVDLLREFVSEFEDLKYVALINGAPPFVLEARTLRERCNDCFPEAVFSEHPLSLPLAAMLGPLSLGMVVMEKNIEEVL